MDIFTTQNLIALVTLAALEIVLGVDNIVMISIFTSRLEVKERPIAMRLGLIGAMVSRTLLLFFLGTIMRLNNPIVSLFSHSFSIKDFILIAGGLFLLAKASTEIYNHVELGGHEQHRKEQKKGNLLSIILQIMVVDMIFSLDSVITAVGLVKEISVMISAVIISMIVMIIFIKPVASFVENNPAIKMLALSFLVLIGVLLMAEGFGEHIQKGYIYFAMGFSLSIELLNMRRKQKVIVPSD